MQHIAQFVGQIGKNLKAHGCEHDKHCCEPANLEIGNGQQDAQHHARRGERQGAQAHGFYGGFYFH